jgi:hypothetical protein
MTNGFAEAPASWNVRYITPDGFACQLTLRGETGAELVRRTEAALRWLLDHDCSPSGGLAGTRAFRHDAGQASRAGADRAPAGDRPDPAWCAVHLVSMQRRERDGKVWYSHRTPDGGWCKGR